MLFESGLRFPILALRSMGLLLTMLVMTVTVTTLHAKAATEAAGATTGATAETKVSLDEFCVESEAIMALTDEVLVAASPASLQDAAANAMTRGWFDLAKNLILKGRERKVDFTSVVYQTKSKINSHLKDMANAMRGQAVSTVSPAFEWAQSDDFVAINIKLAHKLDTPATLDCKSTDGMIGFGDKKEVEEGMDDNTTATAFMSYTFKAECKKSAKNFLLHLKLWGGVQEEESSWEYGSVGRVTARLKKVKTGEAWPKLLDDKAKRPGNMHTWWKMQSTFDDAKTAAEDAAKKEKEQTEKKAKEEAEKKANAEKQAVAKAAADEAATDGEASKVDDESSTLDESETPKFDATNTDNGEPPVAEEL